MKTAIDKLRQMVVYYDQQNEHINVRFKSIKDLEKAFDYEVKNNVHSLLSSDERLYHSECVNCLLGYKVYSTNQTVTGKKVSSPNKSSYTPN